MNYKNYLKTRVFLSEKDPYLRPFLFNGEFTDSRIAIVGINPATKIYPSQIDLDKYIILLTEYKKFNSVYEKIRKEQGMSEISRTRLGIKSFRNWIEENISPDILETDIYTYPTSSVYELSQLPNELLLKSNQLFWEIILKLDKLDFIVIYGAMSFFKFIEGLDFYKIDYEINIDINMFSSIKEMEKHSPFIKLHINRKKVYVFVTRHLMYYGKLGNSYQNIKNILINYKKFQQVKMVVFDLDGTLLNNKKSVTEYTNMILNRLVCNNMYLVIATGRAYVDFVKLNLKAKIDYVITNNGAQIESKGLRDIEHISSESVSEVIKLLGNKYITLHYDDGLFTNNPDFVNWNDKNISFGKMYNCPLSNVQKITIYSDKCEEIENLNLAQYGCRLNFVKENKIYTITENSASKAKAIKKIINHIGIDSKSVIVFGDDQNDICMFNEYYGVAVENAIVEVKEKAISCCNNNNEDGVAKWIDWNLL